MKVFLSNVVCVWILASCWIEKERSVEPNSTSLVMTRTGLNNEHPKCWTICKNILELYSEKLDTFWSRSMNRRKLLVALCTFHWAGCQDYCFRSWKVVAVPESTNSDERIVSRTYTLSKRTRVSQHEWKRLIIWYVIRQWMSMLYVTLMWRKILTDGRWGWRLKTNDAAAQSAPNRTELCSHTLTLPPS